jgi:hypothetical protein
MANEVGFVNPVRYPVTARAWNRLQAIGSLEELQRATLLDTRVVELVKEELAVAMLPANETIAAEFGKKLVGSYPRHSVDDPQTYAEAIVSIFREYPPAIGARAIDAITRRSSFIPTRAELVKECEALMGQLKWAAFVVEHMEDERRRRQRVRDEAAKLEQQRAAFLQKHNGKSPLDVLREKGLDTARENENGEQETVGGNNPVRGRDPGRSGKPGGSRKGRDGHDRNV